MINDSLHCMPCCMKCIDALYAVKPLDTWYAHDGLNSSRCLDGHAPVKSALADFTPSKEGLTSI